MYFTIRINVDNAAFSGQCEEISRILGEVSNLIEYDEIPEEGKTVHKVTDSNGNYVGECFFD